MNKIKLLSSIAHECVLQVLKILNSDFMGGKQALNTQQCAVPVPIDLNEKVGSHF